MSRDPWNAVERSLDHAAETGRPIHLWLRDDDAVTQTDALDRLGILCSAAKLPVLLAVIPAPADDRLAAWVDGMPDFTPCQHGWQHRNHAAAGQRALEIGGDRPAETVLAELTQGRRKLKRLFGDRLSDILVPPWNRIDPTLVERLPDLGFAALSTFGASPESGVGPRRINCDLDIMDWRAGRVGRSAQDVAGKLVGLLEAARHHGGPIGLLTHHLAHDQQAWEVLDALVGQLARHPGAAFVRPE